MNACAKYESGIHCDSAGNIPAHANHTSRLVHSLPETLIATLTTDY